jgi:short-subunit dehydrogenase
MMLSESTCLVTGTSRGIGRALAVELSERGARVLAATRDGAHAPTAGGRIVTVALDLSSRESIDAGCDELGDRLREVDVLVNNAGSFTAGQLETQDIDEIYELFQVNLVGLTHLTRRVLPLMLERGSGKIVNHSSFVGYVHFPGLSTYAASKAGVSAFTECLRRELEDTGVGTLEIVTGGVDTQMLQGAAEDLDEHTDPSGWQWMEPDDWAAEIADAIEKDKQTLQPPGKARIGKVMASLPAFVLDALSDRGFERT